MQLTVRKKNVQDVLVLATGVGYASVAGLLAQVWIARGLSVEGHGIFTAALATVNIASPLVGMGVGMFWYERFGEEGDDAVNWVRPSVVMYAATLVAVALLIVGWGEFTASSPDIAYAAYWLIPMAGMSGIGIIMQARYQVERRYSMVSVWRSVLPTIKLGGGLFLVLVGGTVGTLVMSIGVASGLAVLVGVGILLRWAGTPRTGSIGLGEPKPVWPEAVRQVPTVWKAAFPHGVAGLLYLISLQADIVLLSWYDTATVVSGYGIAYVLVSSLYLIPNVLYQMYLMPRMHALVHTDRMALRALVRAGNVAMPILGVVLVIPLVLGLQPIIGGVFGEEYLFAIPAASVLLLSVPFRFAGASVGGLMSTEGMKHAKVKFLAVSTAANIAANLVLIPRFGAVGAAWATVASEVLLAACFYYYTYVVNPIKAD